MSSTPARAAETPATGASNDSLTLADFMPKPTMSADGVTRVEARAGNAGLGTPTEEQVIEALKTVEDPEIPVDLYNLGLIYALDIRDDHSVHIDMTLTAPACPVAGTMPGMVAEAVIAVPGVSRCSVTLVWEPGWTKDRMSEDARLLLDMF